MLRNVIDSSEPLLAQEVSGHTLAYPDEERTFLCDYYPLLSKAGEVAYVHSMVQDVTPTVFDLSRGTSGTVDSVGPNSRTVTDIAGGSLPLARHDDLTLGERLMVARERCGLTKVAVARAVLDPGEDKKPRAATIGAWEQETMGLTLPRLRRLADLYEKVGGISPSWVVLGDGPIMRPDLKETP